MKSFQRFILFLLSAVIFVGGLLLGIWNTQPQNDYVLLFPISVMVSIVGMVLSVFNFVFFMGYFGHINEIDPE